MHREMNEKEEREHWIVEGEKFTSSLRYLETLTVKKKELAPGIAKPE